MQTAPAQLSRGYPRFYSTYCPLANRYACYTVLAPDHCRGILLQKGPQARVATYLLLTTLEGVAELEARPSLQPATEADFEAILAEAAIVWEPPQALQPLDGDTF
jgi:hypothetical protein